MRSGESSGRRPYAAKSRRTMGDRRLSRARTLYVSTRPHYSSYTKRGGGRVVRAAVRGRGRKVARSMKLGCSTRFAGRVWRRCVLLPGQVNGSTPFPCAHPFSLRHLHSLGCRLPGITLGHSGDHRIASTTRGRSTRSETAHETRDTQPESSGTSVFIRVQQLSQTPEVVRKG